MLYNYGSLLFLLVGVSLQITAVHIHQNMVSPRVRGESEQAGEEGGGRVEEGLGSGERGTTTTPPTTTTTVLCEGLGYVLRNGTKWMKNGGDSMNKTQCDAFCGQDGHGRPVITKTKADIYALQELEEETGKPYAWLGLTQLTLTSYQWADGSSMTVDSSTGSTDLAFLDSFFTSTEAYDYNGLDNKMCLFITITDAAAYDQRCSYTDVNIICACECNN